uniref:PARP-type domain-containing protein n=1 Tax=Macrostomum lignano TaxID=282301 RepID=A0A1I8FES9_9PLAT
RRGCSSIAGCATIHRQSLDGRMVRWREVPLSKSALTQRRAERLRVAASPTAAGLRRLASSDGLVAVECSAFADCRLTERLERLPTSMAALPAGPLVLPGRASPAPQVRLIDMGGIVTQAECRICSTCPGSLLTTRSGCSAARSGGQCAPVQRQEWRRCRLYATAAAEGQSKQGWTGDCPTAARTQQGAAGSVPVPVEFVSPPLADQLVKEGFGGSIQDAAFQTLKSDLLAALPPAS